MFAGEDGTIFAHSYKPPFPIIHLRAATVPFTRGRHEYALESGVFDCYGMCFVPPPVNAIVITSAEDGGIIRALSVERNVTL